MAEGIAVHMVVSSVLNCVCDFAYLKVFFFLTINPTSSQVDMEVAPEVEEAMVVVLVEEAMVGTLEADDIKSFSGIY